MAEPGAPKLFVRPPFKPEAIESLEDLRDFARKFRTSINNREADREHFASFTEKLAEAIIAKRKPNKTELGELAELWQSANESISEVSPTVDGEKRSADTLRRYHSKLKAHIAKMREVTDKEYAVYHRKGTDYSALMGKLNALGGRIKKLANEESRDDVDETEFQNVKNELATFLNNVRAELDPGNKRVNRESDSSSNITDDKFDELEREYLVWKKLESKIKPAETLGTKKLEDLQTVFENFDTDSDVGKEQARLATQALEKRKDRFITALQSADMTLEKLNQVMSDLDDFYKETVALIKKHGETEEPDTGRPLPEFIPELVSHLGLPETEGLRTKVNQTVAGEKKDAITSKLEGSADEEIDSETHNEAYNLIQVQKQEALRLIAVGDLSDEEKEAKKQQLDDMWQRFFQAANAGTADRNASRAEVQSAIAEWGEAYEELFKDISPEYVAWLKSREAYRKTREDYFEELVKLRKEQTTVNGWLRSWLQEPDTTRLEQLSSKLEQQEERYLLAADKHNQSRLEGLKERLKSEGKSDDDIETRIEALTNRLQGKQLGRVSFEGQTEGVLKSDVRLGKQGEQIPEFVAKHLEEIGATKEGKTMLDRYVSVHERFQKLPRKARIIIGLGIIGGVPAAVALSAGATAVGAAGAGTLAGLRFAGVRQINRSKFSLSSYLANRKWDKEQKKVDASKESLEAATKKDDFQQALEALKRGDSKAETLQHIRGLIQSRNKAYLESVRHQLASSTRRGLAGGLATGVAVGGATYAVGDWLDSTADVHKGSGRGPNPETVEGSLTSPEESSQDTLPQIPAEETTVTRSDVPVMPELAEDAEDAIAQALEAMGETADDAATTEAEAVVDAAEEVITEEEPIYVTAEADDLPVANAEGVDSDQPELPEGFENFPPLTYEVGPTGPWVTYEALNSYQERFPDLFPPENDRAWLPFIEFANSNPEYLKEAGIPSGDINVVHVGDEPRLDMVAKLKLWYDAGLEGAPPLDEVKRSAAVTVSESEPPVVSDPDTSEGNLVDLTDYGDEPADSTNKSSRTSSLERNGVIDITDYDATAKETTESSALPQNAANESGTGLAGAAASTIPVEGLANPSADGVVTSESGVPEKTQRSEAPTTGTAEESGAAVDLTDYGDDVTNLEESSSNIEDTPLLDESAIANVYEGLPYRGTAQMGEQMRDVHLAELQERISEHGVDDTEIQTELLRDIVNRDAVVLNTLVDKNYTESLGENAIFNLTKVLDMTVGEAIASGNIPEPLSEQLNPNLTVREAFAVGLDEGTLEPTEREIAGSMVRYIDISSTT